MATHPTYPNNTIQEALCELRLKPSDETKWDAKTPGTIFQALGPESFPGMEPINEIGVEIEIGPSGQTSPKIIQGPQRFKFSTPDNTELVQVSSALFAYNRIGSYEHWDSFIASALSHWNTISSIIKPGSIERIGLRYINRIPRPENDAIGKWIASSDFIPRTAVEETNDLKYRFDRGFGDNDRLVITLLTEDKKGGDIILDIDRVKMPNALLSNNELSTTMSSLHDDIWNVFSAAKTEALEMYLNTEESK